MGFMDGKNMSRSRIEYQTIGRVIDRLRKMKLMSAELYWEFVLMDGGS
jgi:hypothetical protein